MAEHGSGADWEKLTLFPAVHRRRSASIEKLWKKIKQHDTHLHYFPTCEALTEKVEQALLIFAQTPEEILTLCGLPAALAMAA